MIARRIWARDPMTVCCEFAILTGTHPSNPRVHFKSSASASRIEGIATDVEQGEDAS